ncbi:MAG: hypothetical protein IKH08_02580 [Prevotella sp.]|jgi:hypothetical protein|nr:hypothetical protein [Prevotella sp.]MDO4979701.1 hypothetical protein [Prevotellaceae bacterium]
MAKIFVIGDREKNEWVSEFDNNKKLLKFKDELTGAKQYSERQAANIDLKLMQDTGFFGDLQVYVLEDGQVFKSGERDSL